MTALAAPAASRGGEATVLGEASRLNFALLLFGGGAQYDLSAFVTEASWTDSFDAPAQEMDLTLADPRIPDPNTPGKIIPLRTLIQIGMGIRCFADAYRPDGSVDPMSRKPDGTYQTEFYRGYIFGKSIDASTDQDMVTLTCYDELIYLAKNDLDVVYKNTTATAIITKLLSTAGIKQAPPGQDFQDTAIPLKRLVSYGNSLYDVAYLALQKTWMLTGGQPDGTGGKRYRLRSEVGQVTLRERLQPKNTWFLVPNDVKINGVVTPGNILSATKSTSIENMLTGFDIRHTGVDGRRQFGGSYSDPALERLYGRMRQTVDVPTFDAADVKKVMAQQKALVGIPDVEIAVSIPLTHGIRAGDVVLVQEQADTNIKGKWYVEAVTHDLTSTQGTTTMTLVKTIAEADVVDKSSIEVLATTVTKSYSRIKDAAGKYIKYTAVAKVVDFTGQKVNGSLYSGSETVIEVNKSIDIKQDTFVDVYSGTHYKRAQMVSTMTDSVYDVYVSKLVAEGIGIKTGDKVDLYPLGVTQPASVSSTTSSASGSSTAGYDLSLVADIITVAKQYGANAALMVADSIVESGLQYHPTPGDNGTSFGPYQMHKGGALGSHTQAWAESNDTSPTSMLANRAQAFAAAGAVNGTGAAIVQGPSLYGKTPSTSTYAAAVDAQLPTARNLINQISP